MSDYEKERDEAFDNFEASPASLMTRRMSLEVAFKAGADWATERSKARINDLEKQLTTVCVDNQRLSANCTRMSEATALIDECEKALKLGLDDCPCTEPGGDVYCEGRCDVCRSQEVVVAKIAAWRKG